MLCKFWHIGLPGCGHDRLFYMTLAQLMQVGKSALELGKKKLFISTATWVDSALNKSKNSTRSTQVAVLVNKKKIIH